MTDICDLDNQNREYKSQSSVLTELKCSERQLINNNYERENKWKPAKQCKLTSQVKKTKQKEEKYKNTTKMIDVRIMKK